MPRATKKTAKPKGPGKTSAEGEIPQDLLSPETAAGATTTMELEPPTRPVEEREETKDEETKDESVKSGVANGEPAGPPVTPLNIAKLQAMSMTDLNQMAKEMAIENFGTMRKHEVIFHILQKNAERSGVLFSEGVLEVLPEGFGFLRSQSFNYLPCPEDIYVSPSQIRRFDLQTGNLVAGQIRPPKEKERFFALLKVEAVDQEDPDKPDRGRAWRVLRRLFPTDNAGSGTAASDCRNASCPWLCPGLPDPRPRL